MATPLPPNDDHDDDVVVIKDVPPRPPQEQKAEEPEQQPRRAVLAPLPLDWTRLNECNDNNSSSIIRYPWDVADTIDITTTDTNLTLVGTAGQKITRMGSTLHEHVSPNLTHLILRSHLIRTMEGIRYLEQLELLELYDNIIDELRELGVVRRIDDDKIAAVEGGKKSGETELLLPRTKLRVLDISYNVIRDMGPIALCPNLQELCE